MLSEKSVTIKRKNLPPFAAISSVNSLVDVTGWAELGCEKWALLTSCSPGLRAVWATVYFNKSGECLFLKADEDIILVMGIYLEGTKIHLMSFSKYFSELQNLRYIC